jgi:ketosteroid isomerase-like protein
MSAEKNVQIVKNFLAALGRRDKQDLLALSAEDIEWIIPGEDWPLAGTHRGHAGLENLLQKANETVETSYPEPPEFIAQGDRVLVIGFAKGRIKATKRTFEDRWVFAITVRNGKLTNIREYIDTSTGAGFRDGREPQALTHRAVSSRQSESAGLGECMIANVLSESRSVTIRRHGARFLDNTGSLFPWAFVATHPLHELFLLLSITLFRERGHILPA